MTDRGIIRFGGWSLAAGAVAFLAVFMYLAAKFNYPDVLDGPAETVLPSLLATGAQGRAVWAIYAFLPLIWLPAGVAAYEALSGVRRGAMRLAFSCTIVAAIAMMLGLMRWPTMHWSLAGAFAAAAPPERAVITAMFDGLNTYLGNYIGEFLGELAFNAFFLLTAIVWLRASHLRRWVGWLGVATAIIGFVAALRNVTSIGAPASEVSNYLLPLYMIILGIQFIRWRATAAGMPVELDTRV